MAFALRCPECRKAFKWEPLKDWPDQCPLCDAVIEKLPDDNVISVPAFLSAKTRANDKVYRDIENAAAGRAEQAGDPSLKITNMRDNTQVGEISAMPVVNEVTKTMDAINARGGQVGWQGSNGVEYSGAVQTGAFPNMGAKVRSLIQRENGMVSDRPAIETQQPGYRIRG